ncbi:MAG TPA: hypothetical protein VKU91_07220 [Acidimicrobiales bacterium]|nr:hypothetical protein [Acidimicrobiales bacterium]
MIGKILRRATQPTHETNRRALAVLAAFLLVAVVYLAYTHHLFGGGPSAATTTPPPAAPVAALSHPVTATTLPAGPAPNFSRNPFQGP